MGGAEQQESYNVAKARTHWLHNVSQKPAWYKGQALSQVPRNGGEPPYMQRRLLSASVLILTTTKLHLNTLKYHVHCSQAQILLWYFKVIILKYLACGPLNVCSTFCTLALYQQLSDVLLTTHIYVLIRNRTNNQQMKICNLVFLRGRERIFQMGVAGTLRLQNQRLLLPNVAIWVWNPYWNLLHQKY